MTTLPAGTGVPVQAPVDAGASALAASRVSFLDVVTTPALLALAVLAVLVLAGTVLALWALWRTRPR